MVTVSWPPTFCTFTSTSCRLTTRRYIYIHRARCSCVDICIRKASSLREAALCYRTSTRGRRTYIYIHTCTRERCTREMHLSQIARRRDGLNRRGNNVDALATLRHKRRRHARVLRDSRVTRTRTCISSRGTAQSTRVYVHTYSHIYECRDGTLRKRNVGYTMLHMHAAGSCIKAVPHGRSCWF